MWVKSLKMENLFFASYYFLNKGFTVTLSNLLNEIEVVLRNYEGIYLGNETCQESFVRNFKFYLELCKKIKKKDKRVVLVIPPLTDIYFKKIIEKIHKNIKLFDEITVNDFGTFYFLREHSLLNLGRQIIKFKTGNINLKKYIHLIKEEEKKELQKPLISNFILKENIDFVNFLELNPVLQGIDLEKINLKHIRFCLHWPYVLNTTTFMCYSNLNKKNGVLHRVIGCKSRCIFVKTSFLRNSYLLNGNSIYFENVEELEDYLLKINGKEKIKRIVFSNIL